MKFLTTTLLAFAAKSLKVPVQAHDELPITTTDVFVQSGEISDSSAIIMVRCNHEKDSEVRVAMSGGASVKTVHAFAARDYTASVHVEGLSSDTKYYYTAVCAPLDGSTPTHSSSSSFKTAPAADDDGAVSFVWVGDLSGQGWGRNPDFEVTHVSGKTIKGGYVVFDTMSALNPDFALFQGDMIYADGPIPPTKAIPAEVGGGVWINNPSCDIDAITLDDFRAHWKYNFGDDKMQNFLSQTPIFVQWDDHEVTNNWYPGEVMGPSKYPAGTSVDGLYANSLQAFYEMNPIMEGQSIYRKQRFGKHVEIFFVDYRSFRDVNPCAESPEPCDMMGEEQLEWLKQSLAESEATWKIISSHDPLAIVTGGPGDRDSFSDGTPAIMGREHELKDLFGFLKAKDIKNVISLTSDVHYTAHVNLDPARAEGGFTDYNAIDEFVIGPIHAGAFGPNAIDTSFGAMHVYEMGPSTLGLPMNLPPSVSDLQSFGHVDVSEEGLLTIKLIDITGKVMYTKEMTPSGKGCKGKKKGDKCNRMLRN